MIIIFAILAVTSGALTRHVDKLKNSKQLHRNEISKARSGYRRVLIIILVLGVVGTVGLTSLGIVIFNMNNFIFNSK